MTLVAGLVKRSDTVCKETLRYLPAHVKHSIPRSLSDDVLDTDDEDLYRGDMDASTSMAILLSYDGPTCPLSHSVLVESHSAQVHCLPR